jgi:hypothetical protein
MPKRSRRGVASRPARVVAADQGEGRQVDADRPRRGSLADDQVQDVVLHRRIEDLLHIGRQAVDLVDEQHVARFEIGQDGRQIAGLGQHRPAGGAEADAQLAGDDLGQGGLAQSRRPEQQDVVQGLVTRPAPRR